MPEPKCFYLTCGQPLTGLVTSASFNGTETWSAKGARNVRPSLSPPGGSRSCRPPPHVRVGAPPIAGRAPLAPRIRVAGRWWRGRWNGVVYVAAALSVSAVIWWFLQRSGASKDKDSAGTKVFGWITAALAVASVVLTFLTGHSGAEAVWGGVTQTTVSEDVNPESADEAEDTDPDGVTATPGIMQVFTLDDVSQRNTPAECWAVISGSVYDLTDWISQHPGGAQRIERMCGTDSTTQFAGQHGNSASAARALEPYLVGTLDQ